MQPSFAKGCLLVIVRNVFLSSPLTALAPFLQLAIVFSEAGALGTLNIGALARAIARLFLLPALSNESSLCVIIGSVWLVTFLLQEGH